MTSAPVRECSNGPLPRDFEPRAYFTANHAEFALREADAVEYLNWCDQHGFTVLGFDVWAPTEPQPTVINGGEFEGSASACREAIISGRYSEGSPVFNIWVQQ